MDLELRHLRVVCAVAESGSVTKAAARLGLAQPALTAQLNRIERTLGGALFTNRDGCGSDGGPAVAGVGGGSAGAGVRRGR